MFLRLEAALALLKAAVKAPPLAGRGCAEADGSDVEEQEEPDEIEWPPTVEELRQSEFLAVLRTCRPKDLENVLATLAT